MGLYDNPGGFTTDHCGGMETERQDTAFQSKKRNHGRLRFLLPLNPQLRLRSDIDILLSTRWFVWPWKSRGKLRGAIAAAVVTPEVQEYTEQNGFLFLN